MTELLIALCIVLALAASLAAMAVFDYLYYPTSSRSAARGAGDGLPRALRNG